MIFEVLEAQAKCVVLFDEIDELLLDLFFYFAIWTAVMIDPFTFLQASFTQRNPTFLPAFVYVLREKHVA